MTQTSDVSVFSDRLEEGDILLLATGSLVGAITRTVDESDFNHCSVYTADNTILHTTWTDPDNCVEEQSLAEAIDEMKLQRIEVRRPVGGAAKDVARNARQIMGDSRPYAYNDLILLCAIGELAARLGETAGLVEQNLPIPIEWELLLQVHYGVLGAGSLTCSEFVQRSLPLDLQRQIQPMRPSLHKPLDAQAERGLWDMLDGLKAQHHNTSGDYRWAYSQLSTLIPPPPTSEPGESPSAEAPLQVSEDLVRLALSAARWVASDKVGGQRLDLDRVYWTLNQIRDRGGLNLVAELVSPGDLARSTDVLQDVGLSWMPSSAL